MAVIWWIQTADYLLFLFSFFYSLLPLSYQPELLLGESLSFQPCFMQLQSEKTSQTQIKHSEDLKKKKTYIKVCILSVTERAAARQQSDVSIGLPFLLCNINVLIIFIIYVYILCRWTACSIFETYKRVNVVPNSAATGVEMTKQPTYQLYSYHFLWLGRELGVSVFFSLSSELPCVAFD